MQKRSFGAKEEGTHVTTASSSGYDSFLNSCCCADDSTESWDSFLLGPNNKRNSKHTGRSKKEEEYDHIPLSEKLSDALLSLVGAAPPVKFIKCMHCSKDELSEMTTPRVLQEMAEQYDQNNLWSVSSDEGDCDRTEGERSHFFFPFRLMKSSACSVISRLSKKKGGRSRGSAVGSRAELDDPITSQRSINEPNPDSSVAMAPPRRQSKTKSAKPKKNAKPKKDAKPKKSHPSTSSEKNKPRRWRTRRTVAMKPPAELHPGASMASNTTYRNTGKDATYEI